MATTSYMQRMKKGGSMGEMRRHPDWKDRHKTIFSLFASDIILYIENPKEPTKNY